MDEDRWSDYYKGICTHISSLVDALAIGSNSEYEVTGPMCVGGVAGTYTLRSPFIGDCQWKVETGFASTTQSQIYISSRQMKTGLDLTGATSSTSEYSPMDALVVNLIPNQSIPITSEWYDLKTGGFNTLYILVVNTANAAFVNIAFRQKRGK